MSTTISTPVSTALPLIPSVSPVAMAAMRGLTSRPRTLAPWLFYDAAGSALFEQITELPEYYPTRTERAIFAEHADAIIAAAAQGERLSIVELGAGTASKTGLLLEAAVRRQGSVTYHPVDVSATALEEAKHLEVSMPGVVVQPQVADYTRDALRWCEQPRGKDARRMVLYIGSSIGNFSPEEAVDVLRNVRRELEPGDSLLLGTDMVKDAVTLVAAYDDAAGVTAAFNCNVLHRLNRELGTEFDVSRFAHRAVWNAVESRMEMHLESMEKQSVGLGELECAIEFAAGETIHTECSYKFTQRSIMWLLDQAGFWLERQWMDEQGWFAVNLGVAK